MANSAETEAGDVRARCKPGCPNDRHATNDNVARRSLRRNVALFGIAQRLGRTLTMDLRKAGLKKTHGWFAGTPNFHAH